MRKATWAMLVALALAAAPASALEPGDLVVSGDYLLWVVDPESGETKRISAEPGSDSLTRIALRPDGVVFFTETSIYPRPATDSIGRFDPDTGERSELRPLELLAAGLAIDRVGNLVIPGTPRFVSNLESQPELLWLDSETGEVVRVLSLPPTIVGINDIALDQEGEVLLSTSRSGIVRVDPEMGEVATVSSTRGDAIAVEADGSILLGQFLAGGSGYKDADAPFGGFTEAPPGEVSERPPVPFPEPRPLLGRILRIDPETGEETLVSESELLVGGTDIAVEADGGIVVVGVQRPRSSPASVVRGNPGGMLELLTSVPANRSGGIAIVPPPVEIDVRPSRITVGTGSRRMLPVVLLGSDLVDVEDVDLDSLAFGPEGAAPVRSRVIRRGHHAFPNLLLFFRAEDAGLAPGDVEACLTGRLGVFFFEACDDVVVRGPARPSHPPGRDLAEDDRGRPGRGRQDDDGRVGQSRRDVTPPPRPGR